MVSSIFFSRSEFLLQTLRLHTTSTNKENKYPASKEDVWQNKGKKFLLLFVRPVALSLPIFSSSPLFFHLNFDSKSISLRILNEEKYKGHSVLYSTYQVDLERVAMSFLWLIVMNLEEYKYWTWLSGSLTNLNWAIKYSSQYCNNT